MSKNILELNSIGTKVKLEDNIIGTIIEITISDNNTISYKIGWWNGRSYSQDYFFPHQFIPTLDEKIPIGFT